MARVAVLSMVFVAVVSANPTIPVFFSEIQTAPDSLERIEFHVYAGWGGELDLSGAKIVTMAGIAVVDSGTMLDSANYVVIDGTNTSGTFALCDDSDYVRLYVPDVFVDTLRLRYPANPHWSHSGSWAPPSGASAALYAWSEYLPSDEMKDFYTWYVDQTPTFGMRNDDCAGGVSGYVYDRDSALNGATVRIASAFGTSLMESGDAWWRGGPGDFDQVPTGPGRFEVTVEYTGYLPYTYPETIALAPNEGREVSVYLQRPVATEEPEENAINCELHQRGRSLFLDADRPGTALVSVYDHLGRVRATKRVVLVAGKNELALPSLGSGVYFAGCRLGERTLKTKFVLY